MLISRLKLKLGAGTAAAACDDYVNVKEAEDSFYLKGCGLSELDFYPKLTTMMMIIINIDVIYPNSDDAELLLLSPMLLFGVMKISLFWPCLLG